MSQHLVITVYLHDRFHGMVEGGSEWPPAPGRLYQALVAGAARGHCMPEEKRAALEWLETLPPPVIGAPHARLGARVVLFVPNNDADSLVDPTDVGAIRTKKVVQPRIPDEGPLVYAWPVEADPHGHASRIAEAADDIYQLGRGVDMAWASGEVLSDQVLAERLARFQGDLHTPEPGDKGALACPAPGTLKSLVARHAAPRLTVEGTGKKAKTYFTNAPKPFFIGVAYQPQPQRLLFDLRRPDARERAAPGRISEVVDLIERIRDGTVARLKGAMPNEGAAIDRCLLGKNPDGTWTAPTRQRVRIVPVPSIGFEHADRRVRRLLIEVPASAPLSAADLTWAFTGLDVIDPVTGEIRMVLTPSEDWDMLRRHYLPRAARWRSVTPLSLSEPASRRRIEPSRRREEAKGGAERATEEAAAVRAIAAALRQGGAQARAVSIRVQREPFEAKGQRAEAFERKPRFPKERLWHVELQLDRSVSGPLVLGDGRYLGLGLMAPAKDFVPGIHAFSVMAGLASQPDPLILARALRRAVMARVQASRASRERLPAFFSGHAADGAPIRGSQSSHLSFAFEPHSQRLLVLAPHVAERRAPTPQEVAYLHVLDSALEGLFTLRAGSAGILSLSRTVHDNDDVALLGRSRVWKTVTPYVVTRHAKRGAAAEALAADVRTECRRLGLPEARVESSNVRGIPGIGLTGDVALRFERPVVGPLLLGRTRHLGGGFFRPLEAVDK